MKDFFEQDAFAKICGVELVEAGAGTAGVRLEVRREHLNSVGSVHGGAIFALADAAFAVAANSGPSVAVAIQCSISYLKAVSEGTLYAQAQEVNSDGRIGSYDVRVTDGQGQTVAVFSGLAYRKSGK